MGCVSHRRKKTHDFPDQKWDYINLADFKAKGCWPGFVYGYLWFSLILSIAVYAVDSFTAVNLLAFNQWSSKIEPGIPFYVSKWIFSGCIIASFVNLAYEGMRAVRAMRRGNVAECYMDSLAARWECIRLGSGQGWRRFLVFAELTKSKKGAEYVALFTYFSFQTWIRVILCSGPRQVVNALTLKSVYEAKLVPTADSVEGSILGFFDKIRALASEDYQQAVILSGMCFTLVVWVFSALFLLLAVLFYVFFLFHWIPRADGGLTGYCERKVNQKLTKVVTTKVNRALAKGQARRARAGEKLRPEAPASLPTLPNVGVIKDDSLPEMPTLRPSDTNASLPAYSSRPATPASIELSALDQKRLINSQSGTSASSSSNYSSRAPLVGAAADMGYGRGTPEPMDAPDFDWNVMGPRRPGTANSQSSLGSRSALGFNRPPPSMRFHGAFSPEGRSSPAPSYQSGRSALAGAAPPHHAMRSATAPLAPARGPLYPSLRNMPAPMPARAPVGDYLERAGTPPRAPPRQNIYPYGQGTPPGSRGSPYGI